jgi:probable phosphoglycerate mutase
MLVKNEMKMTKLVLVNSCHDLSELTGCFYGVTDISLTEKGIFECEKLGEYLENSYKIANIITSPLIRAKQTAEFIQSYFAGVNLEADPLISDINGGDWEDMPYEWILENFPVEFMNFNKNSPALSITNGETMAGVYKRACDFTDKHISAGGNILVISHETVIKNIICRLIYNDMACLGKVKNLAPASITEIDAGENTEMLKFNIVLQ